MEFATDKALHMDSIMQDLLTDTDSIGNTNANLDSINGTGNTTLQDSDTDPERHPFAYYSDWKLYKLWSDMQLVKITEEVTPDLTLKQQ